MNNPFQALEELRNSLPQGEEDLTQPVPQKDYAPKDFKIFYERKGRAGKEATIIECPHSMTVADVALLAKKLKSIMGTGGSARDNEILLQGDRRMALETALPKALK